MSMAPTRYAIDDADGYYRGELAEKFALYDALRKRMDADRWTLPITLPQAVDFLRALEADILQLSMYVTRREAQARMAATPQPTLEDRALAFVTQRHWTPPGDEDDRKRWRLCIPSPHPRPRISKTSKTPVRELQWQCCIFLWHRIEVEKMDPDDAFKAAIEEFAKGDSWVKKAYYGIPEKGYAGYKAFKLRNALLIQLMADS
jgi:hypothetical protein